MPGSPYPETVIEVLDEEMEFPRSVLDAVATFARTGPWRGSLSARKDKFRQLNHDLSSALGILKPDLVFGRIDGTSSGGSHYLPGEHRITIRGRLSLVSFFHELGHAMNMDEREACRWSINLFRRCFPRQYSRLIHVGHTLVRPERAVAMSRTRTF